MADSSPLTLLAPKRQKLGTNLQKCIVCQCQTNELLKEATENSLETFISAVSERRDDVFLRLENQLSAIECQKALWHRSCYKTYTSRNNIAHRIKVEPETSTSQTKSRSKSTCLRSATSAFDASLCVFCQKVYCKRDKSLHTFHPDSVGTTLQNTLNESKDEAVFTRLATIDTKRDSVKYHLNCYRDYTYVSTCIKSENDSSSESALDKSSNADSITKAFVMLTQEIDNDLLDQGKAFSLAYLFARFTSIMGENFGPSAYRADKLQKRLKSHYGDRVVIQSQRGRSNSNLILSSSITVGHAITAATALKESVSELTFNCVEENDSGPENDYSCDLNSLYHTAKSLRSLAQTVKDNAPSSQTISNEHAESLVPDNLYMFLRWLLEDDLDDNPIPGTKEKSPKQEKHRLILSIAQDIIYACNRSVLTPKHIGIGVTVKHLTGSKEVVKLLNRFGHSISYDEVVKLEKSLVQETLLGRGESNLAIPTNISAGTFVQAAADNLDFNEQTLDGKNTTHATTLVLYQRAQNGNFGAQVKTKGETYQMPLSNTKVSLEVLNFSKQCRKLNVPDCLMREENTDETISSSKTYAKCLDMAWIFARLCPSKAFEVSIGKMDKQTCPAWSAFNALITPTTAPLTSIGYCPIIPSSPTEYSTVYTVMKTVQNMMKDLQQKHTVLTFDEAIYCKAKEIQWRSNDEFKDTVIRLGGFHTALTFIAVIGKRYEESGIEDLLVESGVYGSGSVMKIMTGKAYNKGVRALKLLTEKFSRLRLQSLAPKIKNKEDCCLYIESVEKLREAVGRSDVKLCKDILQDIEKQNSFVDTELGALRKEGRNESATFCFWDEFIDMVEILLRFIRAERAGDWNLHIDSLSDMLPYFFAYDRINYARWGSVYFADMKSLPWSAKEVHDEFMNGNHPIKRAAGSFNQVWTDLALEQSINRDSKVKGGIIGFTQQKDAVNRWYLTAHTRAHIVSSTKAMCGNEETVPWNETAQPHKEGGKSRMERDENDVQKLLNVLTEQMLNPFDPSKHKSKLVMNLATGMTASEEVSNDIISARAKGRDNFDEFVKTRLVDGHEKGVLEPLRKNKLKTLRFYRTPVKLSSDSLSSTKVIDADRGFFSRLIVVAKSRSVDLKDILTHELSPVPYSLAHPDSTLRKTPKSKLLHILETEVTTRESPPKSESKCSWIYDGMALVQKTKVTVQNTFGEYADLLLDVILKTFDIEHCERVDVVFDRYDQQFSIKTQERLRRQTTQGL